MKEYKVGDKSKAVCKDCGITETTFKVQDVPVSESDKIVPNILVAICDKCHSVVAIPHQSAAAIKKALE